MSRFLRYGVALVAAFACEPSPDLRASREGAGTTDGGGGLLNGGGLRGSGVSVRVVLGDARVCPGQCTQVRAVVEGPGGYRYSWTPALPPGAGPHPFCPSGTTRIAVEVVSDGELPSDPIVAAATLQVSDSCGDAAAPSDGGSAGGAGGTGDDGSGASPSASGGATDGAADAGRDVPDAAGPFSLAAPSCVTHLNSSGGMQVLDLGGDDSAYVVGMFKGTLSAGAVTLTSAASTSDGFAVRIGSGCEVVWARSLPGASRTIAYQVATDPDGNVVVAGSFDGYLDFGAGLLVDAPFRNVFVAKLDRNDGHAIWNRQYPTTEVPGSNQGITSLAVADNGDIAFTGFGNRSTDFGGGAIDAANASTEITYAAKLDSSGGHRFSRSLPFVGVSGALHPGGAMSVAGIGYGTFAWGTQQLGAPGTPTDVVVRLDAQGTTQSISARAGSMAAWQLPDANEGLAVASDGTLYRAEGRDVAPDGFGYRIASFSPGVTDPLTGPILEEYSAASLDASLRLSVSGTGALFAASQYGSDRPVAGRMLTTVGVRDAIVLRVSRAGVVDWGGRYGTPGDEWDIHVHATPSQGVFIAGYDNSPGAFVARFDPGP